MKSTSTSTSTCLPASPDGPSPSNSRDGRATDLFGREVAPANRTATQASGRETTIPATSGRKCSASSASADLQRSLENKLLALTGKGGSLEYSLTWRGLAMPARRRCCLLRASVRRTRGTGSSMLRIAGYPTVLSTDAVSSRNSEGWGKGLTDIIKTLPPPFLGIMGWGTATARDWKDGSFRSCQSSPRKSSLGRQCHMVAWIRGWGTLRIYGLGTSTDKHKHQSRLEYQVPRWRDGIPPNSFGCSAMTDLPDVLNPAFGQWLMGYPTAWERYAGLGTR